MADRFFATSTWPLDLPVPLILASGSPRRSELLGTVMPQFSVCPFEVDESVQLGESPPDYVGRLAQQKAVFAAEQLTHARMADARLAGDLSQGAIVLAADTTVAVDGQILGKPLNEADARRMWGLLSGRTHSVFTGIAALFVPALAERMEPWLQPVGQVVQTGVEFRALTESDMRAYWASGEPQGKAGAYAIQGQGAVFIPRIEGSYSNVVGLPIAETVDLLHRVAARSGAV